MLQPTLPEMTRMRESYSPSERTFYWNISLYLRCKMLLKSKP